MSPHPEPFRLSLLSDCAETAPTRVSAAFGAMSAASLIVELGGKGHTQADQSVLRQLITLAQSNGAAALIAGDAQLARDLSADGVHLSWSPDVLDRYRMARDIVGKGAIVGGDAGQSRHDAMQLGEAGADYVAFAPALDQSDREAALISCLDAVAWWAEIFEPPAMALNAESAEEAQRMAEAGADFVTLRLPAALPLAQIAGWVRTVEGVMGKRRARV